MVDVKPTNLKLQVRARRILREICGDRAPTSDEELDRELDSCSRNVKLAAVKIYLKISVDEAESRLRAADGVLANVIKSSQRPAEAVNGLAVDAEAEYVLCIDGGGSKCSAVLVSNSETMFQGESGPCNPYVNLDCDSNKKWLLTALQDRRRHSRGCVCDTPCHSARC